MSRSVKMDYEQYRRDPVGVALVQAIHDRKELEDYDGPLEPPC